MELTHVITIAHFAQTGSVSMHVQQRRGVERFQSSLTVVTNWQALKKNVAIREGALAAPTTRVGDIDPLRLHWCPQCRGLFPAFALKFNLPVAACVRHRIRPTRCSPVSETNASDDRTEWVHPAGLYDLGYGRRWSQGPSGPRISRKRWRA
jgi:hypothetical protein